MNGQKVVITGGPYSGKTTLIRELEQRGFATVPEAAIEIIKELNHAFGIEGQKQWRRTHLAEFQTMVIQRQIQWEAQAEAENTLIFCDRGQYDTIAYFRLYGVPLAKKLRLLIENAEYDRIFLLDTLSAFSQRPDTGRTSDQHASLRIRDFLDEAYREYGYAPIRIPELPVQERVNIVLLYYTDIVAPS